MGDIRPSDLPNNAKNAPFDLSLIFRHTRRIASAGRPPLLHYSATPQSLFPTENPRKKTFFWRFGDKAKTKHVSAKFDLVLDELQDFPLTGTQCDPVQNKGMLNVLGSENKPSP